MSYESTEDEIERARNRYQRWNALLPTALCQFLLGSALERADRHETQREEAQDRFETAVDDIVAILDTAEAKLRPYTEAQQTYLTAPDQEQIVSQLNTAAERIEDASTTIDEDYLREAEHERITDLHGQCRASYRDLDHYNETFVSQRIEQYDHLFSDIDEAGHDLNDQQCKAVVRDDKHNLVIAGAGSGKTAALTRRIGYLTQREEPDRVDPSEILAVTYTNAATEVMSERLEAQFGITDVHATTFHSLGNSILAEQTNSRPEPIDAADQRNFIEKAINREVRRNNSQFRKAYFEFLQHFYDPDLDETEFEDKAEQVERLRAESYQTLRNETVRSRAEKRIADFLFLNQVDYLYEDLATWAETGEEYGEYSPDFYLPEHDLYIEHWGIDETGEVAGWFTMDTEAYLEKLYWARKTFAAEPERTLVETYDFERKNETLEQAVQARLEACGVKFTPMNYEEFVESAFEYGQHEYQIINLFRSYIQNAKQLGLDPDDVDSRIQSSPPKAHWFTLCAALLYRQYVAYLENNDLIDFADMIHRAADLINEHPETYENRYQQVLVDEFQDISAGEMALLKGLVTPENDTKLFCVGDDWQSIYAFTGSDVTYFINFADYFPDPTTTQLAANYRCPETVIDAGNTLIANNDRQIEKTVVARSGRDTTPRLHVLGQDLDSYQYQSQLCSYAAKRIAEFVADGAQPSEIMVLCRVNHYYDDLEDACGEYDIPCAQDSDDPDGVKLYSVHQAKGSEAAHVLIIHAVEHLHGFPSQTQDSELLDPVRIAPEDKVAEERRLFYVALTRADETLDIVTHEHARSRFVNEIDKYLTEVATVAGISASAPSTADEREPDRERERVTLPQVEVVDLWDPHDSMRQVGLLGDGTETIRFVIWKNGGETVPSLEESAEYVVENARLDEYEGSYSVYLDDGTTVQHLEDGI